MAAVAQRTPVIAGLSFPYFPPRPTHGRPLNKVSVKGFVEMYSKRYHIGPKLNGDRAMLLVQDGKVSVANRHGGLYSFSVRNASVYGSLCGSWLLDGEVIEKAFHPFEVVVSNDTSLRRECPSVRARLAEEVTAKLGQPYLFRFQGQAWLDRLKANAPTWEGVVLKRLGSPYLPLSSATQNTETWMKAKW